MASVTFAVATRVGRAWRSLGHALVVRTGWMARRPGSLIAEPSPRTIGSYAAGRQLAQGNVLMAGELVSQPAGASLWEIEPPSAAFAEALHAFDWIDDLAVAEEGRKRGHLLTWTLDWIARHGSGGVGWTPEIAARRLIGLITHGVPLLGRADKAQGRRLLATLGRHARFLRARWRAAAPGADRITVLTAQVYAGVALEGWQRHLPGAIHALGEAATVVGADGSLPNRNPDSALRVLSHLLWARRTLTEAGREPHPEHLSAIRRLVPALRALRLGDGTLARFHGAGTAPEGQLDQTLAEAGIRVPTPHSAMGFDRLSAGRTALIADAAPPPAGRHSPRAHASTLAFEMSSGRREVLISTGPGEAFGPSWRRAARATAAHSALAIEKTSSSRLAPDGFVARTLGEQLLEGPREVTIDRTSDHDGAHLAMEHDGYLRTHGLLHARRISLSIDGRRLSGTDRVHCPTRRAKRAFARRVAAAPKLGVSFHIHFHLHPEVEPRLDLGGTAVTLRLPSGEAWIFRHEGGGLTLEPSTYLDAARIAPRPTKQIVLSARAVDHEGAVSWSLFRADGAATRDLA